MQLLPFGSVQACPMCQWPIHVDFTVKYSTDHVVDVGNGQFVSTQTAGDPLVPHLEKHCGRCGFGWLEETADAPKKIAVTDFTSGRTSYVLDAIAADHCKATVETRK